MSVFKKILALLLSMCMMISIVPISVSAVDIKDIISNSIADMIDSLNVKTTSEDDTSVMSLTMGTKPANGTTTKNPFVQGTGGSNSFRIPAMVTLNDGTIVAAADARWNTTYDGGGLDTIVSYSTDNGANWNYTFANYLGDNGNTYNGSGSTAFIDPALATDGSTVYMLCDLYPYGVALNGSGNTAPETEVGLNSDGTLKLAASGSSAYNYYLKDGQIYNSSNSVVSGYTVDAYFNITGNGYNTNLFFSDSPYQVVRTGYLYLTKSTDGGKTWSAPTLIPNVKTSSEQVCLVGPGRGLVTGNKIIFPVYSYNGSSSSQRMGFIYSADSGATWTRVDSSIDWSSEAAVVELSDGTLRFFYRNGTSALCYADYSWKTESWGKVVNTGIATNSNTQISAISYSKTVGGKQVILVSCPTGSGSNGSADSSASARLNGKIFVGLVNSDKTMDWQSDKAISVTSNNSQFMYSCLTELNDGKVAILYENKESAWGTGDNCYYTMDFKTYDLTNYVTFDEEENTDIFVGTDSNTNVSVTVDSTEENTYTGWSMTVTDGESVPAVTTDYQAYEVVITKAGGTTYTGSAKVTLPVGNLDTSNGLYGFVVESDGTITKATDGALSEDRKSFTFTAPHFSVVGLAEEEILEDTVSAGSGTATSYILDTDGLDSGSQYLIVYKDSASAKSGVAINTSKGSVTVSIDGNNATPEGDASAALWTITSYKNYGSTYYYINNVTNYLYPSRSWSYSSYTYSLNVSTTQTETIISRNNNTYSISTNNYLKNGYINYDGSKWTATNSIQYLYFYKYTEGTQSWTVDPSLQEQRIANLTVSNDGYTTDSWNAYETALNAANAKLTAVKDDSYSSKSKAQDALTDLTGLVDALEIAKNNLKKPVSITINYKADNVTVKTETLEVAEDTESVTLSSTIVGSNGKTYDVSSTTLTLNLPDTTTYSVAVTEREGTAITIKETETTTISVELQSGQTVEWSSADSSYVGVAGKYDTTAGAYTNEAILAGQNVTSSPVTVTATIKDSDGNVVRTEKWLVTVEEGDADTNTNTRYIYIKVDTIQNCTVYYSINGGELIPVNGTGVLMNGTTTGHWQITFFAAPEEGYALTYMASTNSKNQYYTLSDGNPDGTGSDAWPFKDAHASTIPNSDTDSAWKSGHGFRWALLEGNMTIDQMKVMFSNALALGCDGILVFTKNNTGTNDDDSSNSNNLHTNLSFVAQKLPTVEKTIKSITRGTETITNLDGFKVKIGDTINYSVVVTRYATNSTYGTITYSDVSLKDELTGNAGITNPDMGTSTSLDKTYSYTTSITLTKENFGSVVKGGTITNEAVFSYSYSSQYSEGHINAKSSAVVDVTVDIPSYVIDFGLPVEINLSDNTSGGGRIVSCKNGQYGTAVVNETGTGFTYTPTQILQGIDYVEFTYRLDNDDTYDYTYRVAIYPATTVYYEESFLNKDGNWSGDTATTRYQSPVKLGSAGDNNYGYDSAYAGNDDNPFYGSYITSNNGGLASFTFTGTGFELYANSDTSSGYVTVYSQGKLSKLYMINTILSAGGDATSNQTGGTYYSLPIISETDLPHGEYTVKIKQTNGNAPIYIDGVRIINTLEDSTPFTVDKEDNPTFYELRDYVLNAIGVENLDKSDYIKDPKNDRDSRVSAVSDMAGQVYTALGSETQAVIIDDGTTFDESQAQDLLDNGPKNELYLYPGQTLAFNVTTNRVMQLGLKSPTGSAQFTLTVDGKALSLNSLSTTVDMFYKISEGGSNHTVSINVTGGVLSVTKLKVCDDPNFTFNALTETDITNVLLNLYGFGDEIITGDEIPEEPETPAVTYADACLDITVTSMFGRKLGTVTLTANGADGESHIFTSDEILEAVKTKFNKNYIPVGDSALSNAVVKYGETVEVELQEYLDIIPIFNFDIDFDKWKVHWIDKESKNYTITASAGEGGSISNEGDKAVKFNGNVTYTFTPDEGYEVLSVVVDGKDMGAISKYTFKNVRDDHTISVEFCEEVKHDNGKNDKNDKNDKNNQNNKNNKIQFDDWFERTKWLEEFLKYLGKR